MSNSRRHTFFIISHKRRTGQSKRLPNTQKLSDRLEISTGIVWRMKPKNVPLVPFSPNLSKYPRSELSTVSNTQPRTATAIPTELHKQLNCILRMHSLNVFAWEIFHSSRDDLWLVHATMGRTHESRRWRIFGLTCAMDVAAVEHAPWHMANRRPFCTPH